MRAQSSIAFHAFLAMRLAAMLAVQTESTALGWQVYAVARRDHDAAQSAFLVGMVGLAQFVPLLLLALPAGAVADRRSRRAVIAVALGAEVLCAIALAALAHRGAGRLGAVFLIAPIFGAARAFLSPAASALGLTLVPESDLPRAISWGTLADQLAAVVGPWVGGALCTLSPAAAYAGATVLYALALTALLGVPRAPRMVRSSETLVAQIREGLVYIRRSPIVLGALSLDLFAVLVGGTTALLPAYARDVLHVGADGFGALRAGPAAGGAIVALALARWPLRRRAGYRLFAGVAVFGMATLVFALSRSLVLSIAALGALGAADMVSVYVRQALVQHATPDALRGRVSAVASLFIGASAELGEFETGLVARLLGPVGAAVVSGVGSLLVTGGWAWAFPALRRADRPDSTGAVIPAIVSRASTAPAC